MNTLPQSLIVTLLTGLILISFQVQGQTPSNSPTGTPTDAQVRNLENQIKSLQAQLNELKSANSAASRQHIMQQNWQAMQSYMGSMYNRWGTGYPWLMRGQNAMSGNGRVNPMVGGAGSDWPLPKGMDPSQYWQKMWSQMQLMQRQMSQIAQTKNPSEREKLLQQHWQDMYRYMQTMRGMGWMWNGSMMGSGTMGPGMMGSNMMGPGMMGGPPTSSTTTLPDPNSKGAKLVSTYCAQCHAIPQPSILDSSRWPNALQQMQSFMNFGGQGIKMPTKEEMKTILSYMQDNAP